MNGYRTAVITGASAGIGKAAARAMLAKGWRVIGVGRDPARCAAAQAELGSGENGANFTMLAADLSLLSATAQAADWITAMAPRVDVLINNAGGVYAERIITAEGNEATFAANHLAPFLLTQKLMPALQAAAAQSAPGDVRIIGVSSTGHEHCPAMRWDDLTFAQDFVGGAAYCHAKLANMLFTRALAARIADAGMRAHVMHPGVVDSNFASHCEPGMRAYMESQKDRSVTPEHAAQTLVMLATSAAAGASNGGYWHDCQPHPAAPAALDDTAAERLWAVSEELVSAY